MRRALLLAIALGLFAQLGYAQAAPARDTKLPGDLLIRLLPSVDARAFGQKFGLSPLEQLKGVPVYRFAILDGSPPRDKAARLTGQAGVISAEPNQFVVSPWAQRRQTWVVGSDADGYAGQWAPERIGLRAAHAVTRGEGVTVAILDTGIDPEHPALKEHLIAGYDFIDADADPREGGSAEADPAFGHGTHVAGLVALAAPDAKIMPLRTLRPDGSGDLWTQIVALRYAAEQRVQVINLSFSFGERSRLFDAAIAAVTCTIRAFGQCSDSRVEGALVVAAAGNSGSAVREFPGATPSPGLIGVAATNNSDHLAEFSTYGSWLRMAAPGEAIISTVPGGGYAAWSGTSMATPLVAGTAALVRAAFPALSPGESARRIVETSDEIDAAVDHRLDAGAAVAPPCADADDDANDNGEAAPPACEDDEADAGTP